MEDIQVRMASDVDRDFFLRQEDNRLSFPTLKRLLVVHDGG